MESDVASFIDVGKLLKRTAPENLNVFFPKLSQHQVRVQQMNVVPLSCLISVNSAISNKVWSRAKGPRFAVLCGCLFILKQSPRHPATESFRTSWKCLKWNFGNKCEKSTSKKRREVNRKNANILDELNSYPEIFSLS